MVFDTSTIVFGITILALSVHCLLTNSRIKLLESKLMQTHKHEYIAFAKTQTNLDKVAVIKSLRQQFPELSLIQAVEIYNLSTHSD